MRRVLIALAGLGGVMAAAAWAQDAGLGGPDGPFRGGAGARGGRAMLTRQDREALVDARIAALHAGLRLSPDQEKLWPPVEEALRGLARQRQEARAARRERLTATQDSELRDIPAMLRFLADRQAASAGALRRLADASGPLHAVLDEGQKRRLAVLTRIGQGWGMRSLAGPLGGMRRGAGDGFGAFAREELGAPAAR